MFFSFGTRRAVLAAAQEVCFIARATHILDLDGLGRARVCRAFVCFSIVHRSGPGGFVLDTVAIVRLVACARCGRSARWSKRILGLYGSRLQCGRTFCLVVFRNAFLFVAAVSVLSLGLVVAVTHSEKSGAFPR